MKVWIVCDNNHNPSIIIYSSLEKAENHIKQYSGFQSEDCWIFDEHGTEVK